MTFREFWPIYVRFHRHPVNRILHLVGSAGPAIFTAAAIVARNPWWLAAIPFFSYGFAWVGHFAIEHNRPATFDHFWYSLAADYRMCWLMLTGRMGAEVRAVTQPHAG